MFVIILSSLAVVDGYTTRIVGPFESLQEAGKWAADNDDALNRQNVKHVTAEYMTKPVVVS